MIRAYEAAIRDVEELLLHSQVAYEVAGWKVELVRWPSESIRVAEVSWTSADNKSGVSFMQSDLPWGLAVCAQAERCVVARIDGWPDNERVDMDDTLLWLVNAPPCSRSAGES